VAVVLREVPRIVAWFAHPVEVYSAGRVENLRVVWLQPKVPLRAIGAAELGCVRDKSPCDDKAPAEELGSPSRIRCAERTVQRDLVDPPLAPRGVPVAGPD
jgi:hypothetical protein